MALFTETWDGTSAGWPAQWETFTSSAGTIADRLSGRGRLATGTVTYGRAGGFNLTPLVSTDYTLTVDLVLPILSEWYAYVHVRSTNFAFYHRMGDAYQIRLVGASGGVSVELWETNTGATTETYRGAGGVIAGGPLVAGDTVRLMIEVSGTSPVVLKEKCWKVGTTEPAYTTLSPVANFTGAHFNLACQGGNNAVSENLQWDDLDLTALGTAATQTVTMSTPVTNTEVVFSPGLTPPPQAPVLPLVTNTQSIFTVAVALNLLAIVPFVTSTETVFAFTVIPNAAPVLPLVTNTETVFSPRTGLALPTQDTALPLVYVAAPDQLLDEDGVAILTEDGGPIYLDGTGSVAVFSPSAAIITGTQAPVLPLVSVGAPTLFAPSAYQVASLPLVTVADPTIFNMTVTLVSPMFLPLVTVPDPTVFAFVVTTTGTLVAELLLVSDTAAVFTPQAVQVIPQTAVLPLVSIFEGVFAPSLEFVIVEEPAPFIFEPPHDSMGPRRLSEPGRRRAGVSRVANDLSSRYAAPRSFSVLKNGDTYTTVLGPTVEQTLAADIYYAGGHIYEVDSTEAAALEAAGYEVQGYP